MIQSIARDPAFEGLVAIPGPPKGRDESDIPGRWPRLIVLDNDTSFRLKQFLTFEIDQCWQERNTLVEDWIQWQKDYWAKPAQKVRNFPFARAANVVIPMTAIAVETIYARLLNTLFSVKPFWSLRPRTTAWIDASPRVEKWLQAEAEDVNSLDVYGFARESLLELIKFGTGIGKSGYERDLRKVNVDLPDGTVQEKWIERKNGATLDYVPLANFLLRLHEKDPQLATWVGEEHNGWTWSQLKREALSGRIDPKALEEIKHYINSQGNRQSPGARLDEERRKMENAEPNWYDRFDFQEVWLSFDVDGDGIDEEIVVDFHKESETLLSVRYNWYSDLHRPYRIGVYIPVEGRWAGLGVGKQGEQFQALITTIHRQRLDAGTLANMGQIAVKKTSGYGPGEPIFPGKMWFLDDVNDIKEFSLSDTQHMHQLNNEDTARQYSDKRMGVNELNLGMPQGGTPGTATSDLAKLAEGNKKFDMVLRNVRRWYGLIGQDVIANFQQFGNQDRHWLLQDREGVFVEEFLSLPPETVRRGAAVELTVTDSITNKDVEQQKWQGLFALLTQHYNNVLEKAMTVMQVTQDPTAFLMMANMSLRASNEATRRLLETFNVPDVDAFLMDLQNPNGDAGSQTNQPQPSGPSQGDTNIIPAAGMGIPLDALGLGGTAALPPGDGGALA
jgi:hypothetical protein